MGLCHGRCRSNRVDTERVELHLPSQRRYGVGAIKLLLLGTGESGKSTILKQMRIVSNTISDADRHHHKTIIYSNVVTGMVFILEHLPVGLELVGKLEQSWILLDVLAHHRDGLPFTGPVFAALKSLWNDPVIQEAVQRRVETQLLANVVYFLDSLDRISDPAYVPTNQDILHSRMKTTGVIEVPFRFKGEDFKVYDVGGHRSNRKKWIHVYDDVTAIIFIAAVNEYDMVIREDSTQNGLRESLELFRTTCNSKWFRDTSTILFLNKKDLLEQKISKVPLANFFPDYTGKDKYKDAVAFFERRYLQLNKNEDKIVYTHQTCATDTNQVEVILASALDTIIFKNLEGCGMM